MRPLAIALLALVGCSLVNDIDDHRAGGGLDPVPASELCAEVARLMCEGHFDCCSAPTETSLEGCVTELSRRCSTRVGSVLTDPRTGYSEREAAAVLVEGDGYMASCDTELATWATDRRGMLRVLRGTVEAGGECTPNGWFDFAAAYSCSQLNQSCLGGAGGRSYCVDLGVDGDACRANDDCQGPEFYCEGFMPFVSDGTCRARLADGAGCDENTDCQSLVCGESMLCEPLTPEALYCALPGVFG